MSERRTSLLLVLIVACSTTWAEQRTEQPITIEVVEKEKITLQVVQRSIQQILVELKERKHFSIVGDLSAGDRQTPLDISISGTLDLVLQRLLKRYNHVFSYHPDHTISQVFILGAIDSHGDGDELASAESSDAISDESGGYPSTDVETQSEFDSGNAAYNDEVAQNAADLPDAPLTDIAAYDGVRAEAAESALRQVTHFLSGGQFQGSASGAATDPAIAALPLQAERNTTQVTESVPPVPQHPIISPELQEQLRILTQQARTNIKAITEQLRKNEGT
jgi:hypothetical protein|tara:strand:- start:112 stop:945 length:834 start_codon:yes stop_codon:yes gene_type:complete